jgi:hypothetical protein
MTLPAIVNVEALDKILATQPMTVSGVAAPLEMRLMFATRLGG